MQTVLITGASRGLGLEFVRQYLADGWRVIATCRHPEKAKDLKALACDRLICKPLDVASVDGIAALAQAVRSDAIDLLINNAGTLGREAAEIGRIDPRAYNSTMFLNAIAPVLMVQALLPNLERGQGKTVASLSSQMGSITRNTTGGRYAYRSSKAALNAAMKSLAIDLEPRGIGIAVLHPGWVKTDMGGSGADLTPEVSVSNMRKVIAELAAKKSGSFFNYDGTEIPW